ncbi:hypothetical protein HZF24_04845 [Sedimentibacter hydroxybenzoicus DSM 7310]|uniref:Uncharacterized protein n=1 Tax=Sedimentibacter hydroxybenzoicus DSM 7310 TaxID=1123245 RepID=A0A974GVJ9_SEDHY|nr:hypothetical protein [Sedimentibacter hydroxybenzoicus]NYB73462.1 hypothetical protein [Sedimentibacter hydroxybenzoicus DSM 7310]
MKRVYIATTILVILLSVLLLKIKMDNSLNAIFDKWEAGDINTTESIDIMNSFTEYLAENREISTEDIMNLSKRFKIYDIDGFRIIEYVENPEFYGNSGKGSYHIVMYNDIIEIIDSNGSIRIDEVIKLNDNLYSMYVTDYKFSNITGINIFGIAINEKGIEYKPIISNAEIPDGFQFIESLYYDSGHIYFESIENDGSNVLISVNNTSYMLQLREDGLYHFTDIE